jgi:hypothetical protein
MISGMFLLGRSTRSGYCGRVGDVLNLQIDAFQIRPAQVAP